MGQAKNPSVIRIPNIWANQSVCTSLNENAPSYAALLRPGLGHALYTSVQTKNYNSTAAYRSEQYCSAWCNMAPHFLCMVAIFIFQGAVKA